MDDDVTHDQLVGWAGDWLRTAKGCCPLFMEQTSAKISEIPDAIGWNHDGCIVVECKTSLDDLYADRRKPHRTEPGRGLGNRRYYLVTHELYQTVPATAWTVGWGILTTSPAHTTRQVRFKGSAEFVSNLGAERDFLRSRFLELQRFGA